jgi:hypothetical protein
MSLIRDFERGMIVDVRRDGVVAICTGELSRHVKVARAALVGQTPVTA